MFYVGEMDRKWALIPADSSSENDNEATNGMMSDEDQVSVESEAHYNSQVHEDEIGDNANENIRDTVLWPKPNIKVIPRKKAPFSLPCYRCQ